MSTQVMTVDLFSQATTLMIVGMGFVFAFLGLLIMTIHFIIAPLAKKYPDKPDPANQKKLNQSTDDVNPAIVAAITVAIDRYRHKHH